MDSKDSKKWLDIVQSKGVPMLLCLTHADKFYAEHISSDGCHPEELMIRSKVDKKLKVSSCLFALFYNAWVWPEACTFCIGIIYRCCNF